MAHCTLGVGCHSSAASLPRRQQPQGGIGSKKIMSQTKEQRAGWGRACSFYDKSLEPPSRSRSCVHSPQRPKDLPLGSFSRVPPPANMAALSSEPPVTVHPWRTFKPYQRRTLPTGTGGDLAASTGPFAAPELDRVGLGPLSYKKSMLDLGVMHSAHILKRRRIQQRGECSKTTQDSKEESRAQASHFSCFSTKQLLAALRGSNEAGAIFLPSRTPGQKNLLYHLLVLPAGVQTSGEQELGLTSLLDSPDTSRAVPGIQSVFVE